MNKTQSKHEDAKFYEDIERLAGIDLAKFVTTTLVANNVSEVLSAKVEYIAGKPVVVYSVRYRQSFFNFSRTGSSIRTSRVARIGFAVLQPRGYVRIAPDRWVYSKLSKHYYRRWKPVYDAAWSSSEEAAIAKFLKPEAKWLKRPSRGPISCPIDRQKRRPKGFLTSREALCLR